MESILIPTKVVTPRTPYPHRRLALEIGWNARRGIHSCSNTSIMRSGHQCFSPHYHGQLAELWIQRRVSLIWEEAFEYIVTQGISWQLQLCQ